MKKLDQLFSSQHPYPDHTGIKSLFKFTRVDDAHPEYTGDLFRKGKLFLATPELLNDPFECKPYWGRPTDQQGMAKIRKHLISLGRQNNLTKKEAILITSKAMKKPEFIDSTIMGAISRTYATFRVCSLTKSNDNPLFWSHYADSHRGYCIEFDSTVMPIKYAFKVNYTESYPTIPYPPHPDERGLIPVLTKAREWEYEDEYRIAINPAAEEQPKNDGEYLILTGKEIKRVYFGAKMTQKHKTLVLNDLEVGPFSPEIWEANISVSKYSLDFSKL